MEPENEPLEEEIPMKNESFSGSMLVFRGVYGLYTLQGTNISPKNGILKMIGPFPKVGYVNSLEGIIQFSASFFGSSMSRGSNFINWTHPGVEETSRTRAATGSLSRLRTRLPWRVGNGGIPESYYMGDSQNGGTPKSSIFIGFSIINHPFWGTTIFGNTHIWEATTFFSLSFRGCFLDVFCWVPYWDVLLVLSN